MHASTISTTTVLLQFWQILLHALLLLVLSLLVLLVLLVCFIISYWLISNIVACDHGYYCYYSE